VRWRGGRRVWWRAPPAGACRRTWASRRRGCREGGTSSRSRRVGGICRAPTPARSRPARRSRRGVGSTQHLAACPSIHQLLFCTDINLSVYRSLIKGLRADSPPRRSTTSCPRPRPLTSRPPPLPWKEGGTTSWRQDTTTRRRTPPLQTTPPHQRASLPQLELGSCPTSDSILSIAFLLTYQPRRSRQC